MHRKNREQIVSSRNFRTRVYSPFATAGNFHFTKHLTSIFNVMSALLQGTKPKPRLIEPENPSTTRFFFIFRGKRNELLVNILNANKYATAVIKFLCIDRLSPRLLLEIEIVGGWKN